MRPRLTFHPGEMRAAARRLERAAAENDDILEYVQGAPLFDIGDADLANQIMPRLTQVRQRRRPPPRAARDGELHPRPGAALLVAGAAAIGAGGLGLLLNVNGMAESYGRRGSEQAQRGYQPGVSNVPFAKLIMPSTAAGARRLGAALLRLGAFGILGTLAGR